MAKFREPKTLTEIEGQRLFARCLAKFTLWAEERGWFVRLSEVGVQSHRTILSGGQRIEGVDVVHRAGDAMRKQNPSLHYSRRAGDIILEVPGPDGAFTWIREGGTPQWKEAHAYWASLHENCRFGNGKGTDDNHLSLVLNAREDW